MTFLKTSKLTTLALLLLTFTNNSYVKSERLPKLKLLFPDDYGACVNWDNETQSLYTSSKNEISRYDYNKDRVYRTQLKIQGDVNCIIPIDAEKNLFAIAVLRRIQILEWDGVSQNSKILNTLFEIPEDESDKDEIKIFTADKMGRFYGATGIDNGYTENTMGCLYKWEKSSLTKLFCNISEIGGITWNFNSNKMYIIDKLKYRIDEHDYNEATGDISNQKILHDFGPDGRIPDFYPYALAIDEKGYIFLSFLKRHEIFKLDPISKNIEQKIQMPCQYQNSLVFGGPNLDTLYVGLTNKWKKFPCGNVWEVTCLQTKGLLNYKLKIK